MKNCKKEIPLINNIFYIFLQVILIFIFLTVFFFSYITNSEKDSFKLQMNLVIDDLAPDFNVRSLVPKGKEDIATVLIDGSLDIIKKKSMKNSEEKILVNKQNDKVKNKAFLWIGISCGILLITIIILVILGYCVPFHIHLIEGIITVFFIALTEMFFLNIFTSQYWSVDPSEVRNKLGISIQNWIKKHHPVDTK